MPLPAIDEKALNLVQTVDLIFFAVKSIEAAFILNE